ncbi:YhzD family protein [Bacillus sp. FSL K6-3431]|uniref:YhzD family protein n=1 Tax=Bacillus sp. FSL K6-3431 TaxID=2921500 RepID=UPI0030FBEB88
MPIYKLTVFEQNGEKILEEDFEANNDQLAKEKGMAILTDKSLDKKTHRCTSALGKLILFHR